MAQSILETAYNNKIRNMVGSLPYLEFGFPYMESFDLRKELCKPTSGISIWKDTKYRPL
jgi:hypothetical protein